MARRGDLGRLEDVWCVGQIMLLLRLGLVEAPHRWLAELRGCTQKQAASMPELLELIERAADAAAEYHDRNELPPEPKREEVERLACALCGWSPDRVDRALRHPLLRRLAKASALSLSAAPSR